MSLYSFYGQIIFQSNGYSSFCLSFSWLTFRLLPLFGIMNRPFVLSVFSYKLLCEWNFNFRFSCLYSSPLPIFKLDCLYHWLARAIYKTSSRYWTFIKFMSCRYFSSHHGLSFHVLDGIFWSTTVFKFDEVLTFCYFSCTFAVISENPRPDPRLWRFTLMFSSKSFVVLYLGHWYILS